MQQNHSANLLRKTKKNYFTNLNIKDITDSKTFWKTIKPNFKLIVKHFGKQLNQILMRKVPVLVKLYFQIKGLFSTKIRKFV